MNKPLYQPPNQPTMIASQVRHWVMRPFHSYPLSVKLIVAFLIIALIPLGLLTYLNDRATRAALTDAANQALRAAASQTAIGLDTFIKTNLDTIRTDAQSPTLVKYLSLPANQRSGSPEEADVSAILSALSRKDPLNISSYALLDAQGRDVIDTYAPDIGLDESNYDYFQMPLQTGLPYVSPVEFSPTPGGAALYFASPLRNTAEEIIGVLRVRYSAAVLQQLVVQNNNLAGSQSFAVLFDENHIHLAHGTAPETILKSVAPLDPARLAELQAAGRLPNLPVAELSTDLPDLDQKLARATDEPYFTAEDVATGTKVNQVAVVRMETQPWLVAFFQPQEVFLAPAEEQTRTNLLVAIIIAGAVAGSAVVVGQFLARPITHLTAVAQRIAGGDLQAQAPIESRDEIGHLAAVFNIMTAQLRGLIGSLEDQVRERTAELALSMQVGQHASTIKDLDELLPTITEFIREQFNLYYTQVYFVDDLRQNLVLKAGTGAVGAELLARRHGLPVGLGSIVGRVAAEGKAIVASDTANSAIHKPNPLLPDTRCELAVPLIVEGQVIGVLDMQADRTHTFTEQNLTVFEAMATQLGVAINSARQWASAQAAQQKAEEAIRRLTRESWTEKIASQREALSFSYDLSSITPVKLQSQNEASISVPVVIQNEQIGQLAVKLPPEKRLSTDEESLLAAVAQQLAQKAENLRLFQQTEQRAAREQLARQITDKLRASRDIETALKTAAEELSRALAAPRAVIELKVTQVDETDQP